jgi:hypothetical protein
MQEERARPPFLFMISPQTIRVFGATSLRFVTAVPSRVESRVAIFRRIHWYSSVVKTRILSPLSTAFVKCLRRDMSLRDVIFAALPQVICVLRTRSGRFSRGRTFLFVCLSAKRECVHGFKYRIADFPEKNPHSLFRFQFIVFSCQFTVYRFQDRTAPTLHVFPLYRSPK